jgi:hypothetical protein
MSTSKTPTPPQVNPYVFPILLAGIGLWCVYDGWFTTDPDMLKHQLFNQIISCILLPWAIFDFIRTRKRDKAKQQAAKDTEQSDH